MFYVNINGLSDEKINQSDMMKDIDKADLICFTETHLRKEYEPPNIDGYRAFHTLVNRKNYLGRNIKGVSIYCKENMNNTQIEEIVNQDGILIILKLTNVKWEKFETLFLIVCYKEDRESKFKTDDYFERIKGLIIEFKMKNIIMIGDLNGRVGLLNDNEHFGMKQRNSEDFIINSQGRNIINFCNETALIIANGRLEEGRCTFFSLYRGDVKQSMIDYLIISPSLVDNIDLFKIQPPVLYTDHAPMKVSLEIELKRQTQSHEIPSKKLLSRKQNKTIVKKPSRWNNGANFNNDIFREKCKILYEEIEKENINSTDIFVKLVHIKDTALCSTTQKKASINSGNIIYSDRLREYRQNYKRSVIQYKENKYEENLIELLKVKKAYNKILRSEKRKNKLIKLHQLKIAKDSHDHKKYWELINQQKVQKKNKVISDLKAENFKEQIKQRDTNQKMLIADNSTIKGKIFKQKVKDSENELNFEITLEEVVKALKLAQNSKSSGPDGFVYEMLKNNIQETSLILLKLFNNIKNSEQIPWKTSWTLPIYKCGDKNSLSSYRCINLSSCIEKLLTKIINERLSKWFEKYQIINSEQTGFQKGNSVLDNILLLKEVMKIYKKQNRPVYICFLDLSKAFDSVPLNNLKSKLHAILPEGSLLSLIINLIENKNYRVLYNGEETELYTLTEGVPQGDSMSPTLFCLYINDMVDTLRQNERITDPVVINDMKIATVIYADDIVLMSQSQEGIIRQIKIVQDFCSGNGLKINYKKTKVMIGNSKPKYKCLEIVTNDNSQEIEIVNNYKYLGMWLNYKNSNKTHIEALEKIGRKSSFMTTKILKEFGEINGKFLRDTFEMLSLSKMKYCAELCFCDNLSKLNQIQYQFYKRFCYLKITTPNYCLIGEFGIKPIEYHFYRAALRYWIRILQSDEKSLLKQLYKQISTNMEEQRLSNTWCWQIKKLLLDLNLEDLWLNQGSHEKLNLKYKIDTRLKDYFREKWIKSAIASRKGIDYLEMTLFSCETKQYLNYIMKDRSVNRMLKWRTSNYNLLVETERTRNRKPYEERICNLCDIGKVQDVYHVIVECPRFFDFRSKRMSFVASFSKSELYTYFNNISIKQLKTITDFMDVVEDEIKSV